MSKKQAELTIARHWEMLQLLPSKRPGITTLELESQLSRLGWDVSRRTIQRDLNSLSTIFPLECNDKSKPHGWFWMPQNRIDIPGFSVPEALTMQLIEDYMKSMLPLSIVSVLGPQFKQAREKLNAVKQDNRSAGWLDKIRVVPPIMPQIPPTIDEPILETVQQALIYGQIIDVEYSRPQFEKNSQWELHPLGLIQRGLVSYLVCTMFGYDDIRLVAVHRFVRATMLDKRAAVPEKFNLDDYIEEGNIHFGSGKSIKLQAVIQPLLAEFLTESPLSEDMIIQQQDGILRLKATVKETWQLDWWIKSQGSLIEVVKPVSLRNRIKADLQKTLSKY